MYQPYIQPLIKVGGLLLTDLPNLIILGFTLRSAAVTSCPVKISQLAAGGYTPGTGKNFRIWAYRAITLVQGGKGITLGYQDTDTGITSNTSPTNGKRFAGLGQTDGPHGAVNGAAATVPTEGLVEEAFGPAGMVIPNGKYGLVESAVNTAVVNGLIFGYEEDA